MRRYCGTVGLLVFMQLYLLIASAKNDGTAEFEKAINASFDCLANTTVPKDSVINVLQIDPFNTTEGECYRACVLQKLNVLQNGTLNKESALKKFSYYVKNNTKKMTVLEGIIDECIKIERPEDAESADNAKNVCGLAEAFESCVRKKLDKNEISTKFVDPNQCDCCNANRGTDVYSRIRQYKRSGDKPPQSNFLNKENEEMERIMALRKKAEQEQKLEDDGDDGDYDEYGGVKFNEDDDDGGNGNDDNILNSPDESNSE